MISISQKQLELISVHMLSGFVMRMASYLRNAFPHECKKFRDKELQGLIQRGIQKARSYAVVNEADIERFLEYIVILDVEFDTRPWCSSILQREDINGENKMDMIDNYHLFVLKGENETTQETT